MNILKTTVPGSSFTGSCEKRLYRLITDFKEKNELLNVLLKIIVVKLHLFYIWKLINLFQILPLRRKGISKKFFTKIRFT